jgi:hypothetical protein
MTLNPKSLPRRPAKSKSGSTGSSKRMTPDEEKAVAKANQEGKVRAFKNAEEYLKYLDTV